MIFNYINISMKCKCCVLNEEIQGKFGENLWKIRQTTIFCRKYKRWRCSKLFDDFLHVDIRHVLHMNSRACAGPPNRELQYMAIFMGTVLHVIKYRERAHNYTHLHIVCGILCILTRPWEI
jgi:hypothetical protein